MVLGATPKQIRWLVVSVVAVCAVLAITGQLLYPEVRPVTIGLTNIRYHFRSPRRRDTSMEFW